MKFGIGQSVKRTEDIRFVTGQGQYTDDLHFDNETFACFHRSVKLFAVKFAVSVRPLCFFCFRGKSRYGALGLLLH